MTWAATVVGGLLVLTALWDVFHTLWHPSGQGPLTKVLLRVVWLSSRRSSRARRISGPTSMVLIILAWAALIAGGFALIYWPHVPDGFSFDPGLVPGARSDLLDALYLSVVVLATLGLGDVVPTTAGLRLLVPLEALLGFALLTAAVSWVLQVYPALTRRRALALKLDILERAGTVDALLQLEPHTAAGLLGDLADRISDVYVDLVQYSETYYFRDASPRSTLGLTVPYSLTLVRTAGRSTSPGVRHAGRRLEEVLDDLAEVLDAQYLHTGADTAGVLDAYRRDQSVPT